MFIWWCFLFITWLLVNPGLSWFHWPAEEWLAMHVNMFTPQQHFPTDRQVQILVSLQHNLTVRHTMRWKNRVDPERHSVGVQNQFKFKLHFFPKENIFSQKKTPLKINPHFKFQLHLCQAFLVIFFLNRTPMQSIERVYN